MPANGTGTQVSRRDFLRHTTVIGAGLMAAPLLSRSALAAAPKFKTAEDGFITIAMSGAMPMTGYEGGKLMGSDAEMIAAIANKLGLAVKPAIMQWSATIEAIKSGRADIMVGNMSWTPKRADAMLLTDAIYYAGNLATMRADMPFKDSIGIADFKGYSLGTSVGYNFVPDLKKIPDTKEVKLYDTDDAAIRDVQAGRLDFAFLDGPEVDYMVLKNGDLKLKQVPLRSTEGYPLLTDKGIAVMGMSLDNPDLFDAFNAGVKWLWSSKTNGTILTKNGMTSPDYLVAPQANPRIGVDRDESGKILGAAAHTPKDFSSLFG
ncbi:amino acid ABC transporter substrate-binding protein [Mesorhizobium sp. B2-5-4]|uniref:substrate-binding periplasmic protein n=1 Tax=unclassified Mesorhizobium TaxID=325217 RepID=UPI001128C134|nr:MULTISPECIES: ABC transporter substrate-binding protein [unclassified Mesorhizobium]TPK44928.1 amino acid ABC transporter substrate-binding protein [Mesorhizobium sp. B2-5-4]TPM05502.1 amino acid ABC transporter substrate-binding protein [Mesorhizobium sp. B2-3-11]